MELSPQESVERIAKHFAEISQEFEPIDVDKFPPRVRDELNNYEVKGPHIEEYEVYQKIRKAKKPESVFRVDLQMLIMN